MKPTSLSLLLASLLASTPLLARAADTDMQKQIDELKAQNQAIMERLEATAERQDEQSVAAASRVHIGGYGELHYNNLTGEGGASNKKELDFHRFVLYFGYDFTDAIRFHSEVELEHADTESNGAVELEQAFVEFDIGERTRAVGGLFLVPVGILNETHEPTTFYGVERNPVEKYIIPTTWWEGGGGLNGNFGKGWRYDANLTSGLYLPAGTDTVRSGRQKVSEARADSLMGTGRLKWAGLPGLELAATVSYQNDYTQGEGSEPENPARLVETHAIWTIDRFTLRALYATWDLRGKPNGYDRQEGWYVEPSWKFTPRFGIYARYNQWDNQAGSNGPGDTEKVQTTAGINWWPIRQVVLKADLQQEDNRDGSNRNGFHLGLGYQF